MPDPELISALRLLLSDASADLRARVTEVFSDAISYRNMRPEGVAADCRACEKGRVCETHPDDDRAVAGHHMLAAELGLSPDGPYDLAPLAATPALGPVALTVRGQRETEYIPAAAMTAADHAAHAALLLDWASESDFGTDQERSRHAAALVHATLAVALRDAGTT